MAPPTPSRYYGAEEEAQRSVRGEETQETQETIESEAK